MAENEAASPTDEQHLPPQAARRDGSLRRDPAQAFREAGFDAHNLAGGLIAWAEAELPLDPEDGYVAESGEAAGVFEARSREPKSGAGS